MQPGAWGPKSKGKEKTNKRNCTCNLRPGARKSMKTIRNRTDIKHATWSTKSEEIETKLMFTSRDETLLDLEPLKKTNTITEKQLKMQFGALRAQEAEKKNIN